MEKDELMWMIIGNKVQSHFLYDSTLTKERFEEIKKEVLKEIY